MKLLDGIAFLLLDRAMKCPQCNQEFVLNKYQKYRNSKGRNVFCSRKCRNKYISILYRGEKNPFYGKKHSREHVEKIKKINTKTGVSIICGYAVLNRKVGVRFKPKKLHRQIIENFIGRSLNSNEVVHHIDGNKLNNDLSNLQIMTKSEHTKLHNTLPRKFRQKTDEERICIRCGKKFIKKRWQKHKYCASECFFNRKKKLPQETVNYIKKYESL